LPLTLSDIVLEDIKSFFKNQLNDLQSLKEISKKLTFIYIQDYLIIGLVLILILITIFFCLIFNRFFCIMAILLKLSVRLRVIIHFILGMVYYIFFFIPATMLYIFQLKTKELLSKIKVKKSEANRLYLETLCYIIIITLLTAFILTVI
jgi:hypothetical protein